MGIIHTRTHKMKSHVEQDTGYCQQWSGEEVGFKVHLSFCHHQYGGKGTWDRRHWDSKRGQICEGWWRRDR